MEPDSAVPELQQALTKVEPLCASGSVAIGPRWVRKPPARLRPRLWVVSSMSFFAAVAAAAGGAQLVTSANEGRRVQERPQASQPASTNSKPVSPGAWSASASYEPPHPLPVPSGIPSQAPNDDLAQQVAAYQLAMDLRERDPERALQAFRAMHSRWPNGPLAPEINLRIVQLLARLGHQQRLRDDLRSPQVDPLQTPEPRGSGGRNTDQDSELTPRRPQ